MYTSAAIEFSIRQEHERLLQSKPSGFSMLSSALTGEANPTAERKHELVALLGFYLADAVASISKMPMDVAVLIGEDSAAERIIEKTQAPQKISNRVRLSIKAIMSQLSAPCDGCVALGFRLETTYRKTEYICQIVTQPKPKEMPIRIRVSVETAAGGDETTSTKALEAEAIAQIERVKRRLNHIFSRSRMEPALHLESQLDAASGKNLSDLDAKDLKLAQKLWSAPLDAAATIEDCSQQLSDELVCEASYDFVVSNEDLPLDFAAYCRATQTGSTIDSQWNVFRNPCTVPLIEPQPSWRQATLKQRLTRMIGERVNSLAASIKFRLLRPKNS